MSIFRWQKNNGKRASKSPAALVHYNTPNDIPAWNINSQSFHHEVDELNFFLISLRTLSRSVVGTVKNKLVRIHTKNCCTYLLQFTEQKPRFTAALSLYVCAGTNKKIKPCFQK